MSSERASIGAPATRILLIGHDPSGGHSVREALADVRDHSFVVECAPRLVDGLQRLGGNGSVVVLLDLCLPDSEGVAAFEQNFPLLEIVGAMARPAAVVLTTAFPIEELQEQARALGAAADGRVRLVRPTACVCQRQDDDVLYA